MPADSPYDAIVIGAGMSGLAAGIRLAHFGRRVLIVERHVVLGGLNSYYRLGGYDLDVGLHALTNYAPRGPRATPLQKLARALRIDLDDFALVPQGHSRIAFPGAELEFDNDPERLRASVAARFPRQIDAYDRLVAAVRAYDELDLDAPERSGRAALADVLDDPLLADLLLCPLQFYGSAQEDDIDWNQFVIVFKAIYLEGFARPEGGVRRIIHRLLTRYREAGGDIRLGRGVRRIVAEQGRVRGVELDDGRQLTCEQVLSSAGWRETLALCPAATPPAGPPPEGRMSFVECLHVLDRPAADVSIIFYSFHEHFRYRCPAEHEPPVDLDSGVICLPGNFRHVAAPPIPMVRTTHIARPAFFLEAAEADYRAAKERYRLGSIAAAERLLGRFADRIVFADMFTPRTIRHYTGHQSGAVYGCPRKLRRGRTPVSGLRLMGTDQGFLGIVGALLSGVTIANDVLHPALETA